MERTFQPPHMCNMNNMMLIPSFFQGMSDEIYIVLYLYKATCPCILAESENIITLNLLQMIVGPYRLKMQYNE